MTKKKKNEHPGRVYKNILFHFNLDIAKLRENRKTYFFRSIGALGFVPVLHIYLRTEVKNI